MPTLGTDDLIDLLISGCYVVKFRRNSGFIECVIHSPDDIQVFSNQQDHANDALVGALRRMLEFYSLQRKGVA